MKYIVTGGAGFIGSHIVEELVNRQHEVVILDNLFSGRIENIKPFLSKKNVIFVRGSVTDPALLKTVFECADGVFHEGAIASVPRSIANPVATNEANVTGTLNVLVAARDCGVKKVVFASSSSVYGNTPTLPKREDMTPHPLSPYAVSKLAGEQYLKVFSEIYGFGTVSLRYFNVFGPRQDPASEYAAVIPKFITSILSRRSPVIYGDGGQTRDFSYVKDVVQANIRAMESDARGIFNVAYCQRMNLIELAGTIMEITGISVPLTFAPARDGDVRDSLADITRAQKAFGYAPAYTVRSGLEETVAWFREQSRHP
ncbi:MAG: SDR family oxidoreductase [Methanoregula sp.]|nr:SDR family oxidoreductase [Methanoregula sp.]